MDRVTYASTIFGYAKELELAYSEEDLTEKLADHFEKGIWHAFTDQQIKSKNTLFQFLTDNDNDDKRAQSRKPSRDQYKNDVKPDEENEKPNQNQNQYVNENQQRKPWQNINATQIQNKNKSSKRNSEKHTSPVSKKNVQKAHEVIDRYSRYPDRCNDIESEFGKLNVDAFPNSENMQIENYQNATAPKFPNKIDLLSAALIDVREDLAFDIDRIGKITEYSRCPETADILLNEKKVNLLIDTDSEVTAISEKFYNDNLKYFKSCQTLPLCGKFIKAATGNKSTRLKLQVMILQRSVCWTLQRSVADKWA